MQTFWNTSFEKKEENLVMVYSDHAA